MTTGQIIMVVGICLTAAALLLALVGSILLHQRKKQVLRKIEHEYH